MLLRLFGASIGHGCRMKPFIHVTSPWMLHIGDHCWLGERVWIDNLTNVFIGDNVCISQSVYLCTGNHDYRSISFNLLLGSITIEDEVWIAAQAMLAPGAIVRSGAVVGFGAVVIREVPSSVIVRGNPAQVVGVR